MVSKYWFQLNRRWGQGMDDALHLPANKEHVSVKPVCNDHLQNKVN